MRWLVFLIVFVGLFDLVFAVSISVPSSVSIDPGINVLASEFDGDTTNFPSLNNSALGNISSMTLENSVFGKIVFLEGINLTENAINNTVDLNSGVNISQNRVEINIEDLSSLNKPARIYLYNINFVSPRVLRDGVICTDCTILGLVGGTFIFEVTGSSSSVYTAEETPSSGAPRGGGGGGGGGGSAGSGASGGGSSGSKITLGVDFSFDRDPLIVKIKQGQTKREYFRITNTGGERLKLILTNVGLNEFMIFEEDNFFLLPGQYKDIPIDFFAREFERPDVYTGKIKVESEAREKNLNIILEVQANNPLFDIRADLKKKEISLNDNLFAEMVIVNVGNERKVDVVLDYTIKDYNDKIIFVKQETVAVDKSLVLSRKFDLPTETKEGNYVFYVKLTYGDSVATSAVPFKVLPSRDYLIYAVIVASLIILLFIYYLFRRNKNISEKGLSNIVKSQARGAR